MFPTSTGAWIFILVSCLIGFLIGQWLRSRKKKDKTKEEYIEGLRMQVMAEARAQDKKRKRTKKKK